MTVAKCNLLGKHMSLRGLHTILTAFARADSLILGKELEVKTEVSIEYCVV